MNDYSWITDAMFDNRLNELVRERLLLDWMDIPGVSAAVREYYNNWVLEDLEKERALCEDLYDEIKDSRDSIESLCEEVGQLKNTLRKFQRAYTKDINVLYEQAQVIRTTAISNNAFVARIYAELGCSGSFEKSKEPTAVFNGRLCSNRHFQVVVNKETGLLVVDVVHPSEEGGNECVRLNLNDIDLSHVPADDYTGDGEK